MAIDVTAVKTQITRIKTNIDDAFDEAEAKGATMPTVRNSDNLPETIASITVGGAKITGANEINVIAQANINKGDTVRVTAGTTGISVETTPTTLPAGTGYGCAFNHDGTRLAVAHSSSPYITAYGVLYGTPLAYKANNLLSGLAGRYGYAKENISLSANGKVDVLFEA